MKQSRTFIAEEVTPAHPDRVCDMMAHQIVWCIERARMHSHTKVDVSIHRNIVIVNGFASLKLRHEKLEPSDGPPIRPHIARVIIPQVIEEVGLTGKWAVPNLRVLMALRLDPRMHAYFRAGDSSNSLVTGIGHATADERTCYLSPAVFTARILRNALYSMSLNSAVYGPCGMVSVCLEQSQDGQLRWRRIVATIQTRLHSEPEKIFRAIERAFVAEIKEFSERLPGLERGLRQVLEVNPGGCTERIGVLWDTGASNRRLQQDYYGLQVPVGAALHGKPYWSGKIASAFLARQLALKIKRATCAREVLTEVDFIRREKAVREIRARIDGHSVSHGEIISMIDPHPLTYFEYMSSNLRHLISPDQTAFKGVQYGAFAGKNQGTELFDWEEEAAG